MRNNEDQWEADRRFRRDSEREPRRAHLPSSRPRRLSALASIHGNIAATVVAAGVIQPPVICTEADHEAAKVDGRFETYPTPPGGGTQPTYDGTPGAPKTLELRNCPTCASTIARAK